MLRGRTVVRCGHPKVPHTYNIILAHRILMDVVVHNKLVGGLIWEAPPPFFYGSWCNNVSLFIAKKFQSMYICMIVWE
jgi:hypothetical protein